MPGDQRDHIDFRQSTLNGPAQGQGIQFNDYRTIVERVAEPDHARLGVKALRIRDYPTAVRHLGRAIEHDPERAANHYYLSLANLGGVHPCVLKVDTARLSLEHLNRALTALPSCTYARVTYLLIHDSLASRYGNGRKTLSQAEKQLVRQAGKRHAQEITTHVPAPDNAWWRALSTLVPDAHEGRRR
ncbi:hypothetical protein ACFWJM_05655 [Streptomyces sp. NPDC127077]|uniref:hypothetical protein n=1 Tax=Streptomyces sp. NPDC127077 TaxID=3347131 RepID=UPI0036569704